MKLLKPDRKYDIIYHEYASLWLIWMKYEVANKDLAASVWVPFTSTWKRWFLRYIQVSALLGHFKVFLECAKIHNDMHMRLKEVVGGFLKFAGSK